MFDILKTRFKQKHRTMSWPDGPAPELSARYAGRPVIAGKCRQGCRECMNVCPTDAVSIPEQKSGQTLARSPLIDMGKCLFCRKCEKICAEHVITFSREHRLAANKRSGLITDKSSKIQPEALLDKARSLFGHSLKLRQVCTGGCNGCEADTNVLGTIGWDLGRFGIDFVASPRHADGLLITGPVTNNMKEALLKTYDAVPSPKIVIATGACAISGGPYIGHPEQNNGASSVLPVDLYIPGCPPHPLTIIDGLLRFIGRI
ncbi:MAG: 4Fe-4S dicluster domain-containing protein [Deltaproteobacteria bacterium]|nr:4Fe-4S dicluster domain-containing protein [Deltaproteobacteria bacterium]MBW2661005.1 4Fe-4S dicluster domain-containing protein [Deltaproteobacteria bacterium]